MCVGKIARLEQAQAESSEAAESLKQDKARAAAEAARLERSVQLLIKEKNNCLQLLDSYKEEATSQGATAGRSSFLNKHMTSSSMLQKYARDTPQQKMQQIADLHLHPGVQHIVTCLANTQASLEAT